METFRRLSAVGLGIVALTALFSSEEFAHIFLGLSSDAQLHAYSWLQLEIALAGLLGPALVLFNWPRVRRFLNAAAAWLGAMDGWQFWMSVIGVGVVARLVVIGLFDPILASDAAEYDRLGWTLAQAGCYYEQGVATAYRAPGYPFFLSLVYQLCGHTVAVVPWIQLVLGVGIAWLSHGVARKLGVSEAGARLMGVLLVVFPGMLLYTNLLLSELLFVLLLMAGLFQILSARRRWVLSGGGVLGLAILTRPVGVMVIPVLLIYWLTSSASKPKAIQRWSLVLVGCLVVCGPWMMRNDELMDKFTLTTSGGVNFYIGNHEGATFGYQSPDPALFALDDPSREIYHDSLGYALGWENIKNSPGAFVKRAVAKMVYLFAFDADPLRYDLLKADYGPGLWLLALAVFTQAWWLVFLMLAGWGLVRWIGVRTIRGLWLPLLVVIGITDVHAVYFAAGRFHLPLIPFLALFMAPLIESKPD